MLNSDLWASDIIKSLAGACLEAGQGILPLVSCVCMLHVQLRQLVIQQLQEVSLQDGACLRITTMQGSLHSEQHIDTPVIPARLAKVMSQRVQ